MGKLPYKYELVGDARYTFMSVGKSNIRKVVEFKQLPVNGLYNLGFGDLLPDGTINNTVNSNNGDSQSIVNNRGYFKRVYAITSQCQNCCYRKYSLTFNFVSIIIKAYFEEFSNEFVLTGFILENYQIRKA